TTRSLLGACRRRRRPRAPRRKRRSPKRQRRKSPQAPARKSKRRQLPKRLLPPLSRSPQPPLCRPHLRSRSLRLPASDLPSSTRTEALGVSQAERDARPSDDTRSAQPQRLQAWPETWMRALLGLASVTPERRAVVLSDIEIGSQPTATYYVL